jgi:putative nucleotidyltransferase with HDIG domain
MPDLRSVPARSGTVSSSRPRVDRVLPARVGWGIVTAVGGALLLFVFQVNPVLHFSWELPQAHFYIVTGVAALAFVMAVVLSWGAALIRQYSVLFLALGFMAMAGFFVVHGLATPGVILPEGSDEYSSASVLGASAFLSLAAPSALFALSYTRVSSVLERRLPFWPGGGITVVLLVGLVLFGVLSFSQSEVVAQIPLGRPPLSYALAAVSVALLLFAAWGQAESFLAFRMPSQGRLSLAFVLLAEAQVAVVVAPPWTPAWWSYHLLMFSGVVLALRAIYVERVRGRSLRDVLEGVLNLEVVAGLELERVEVLASLAAAIEAKDRDTHGHTVRVAETAVAIGRELGLPNPDLRLIAHAGLLHDIGKLEIPDEILTKPGPLNTQEWEVIKRHPALGLDILDRIGGMRREGGIILAHHERMDGSGYPRGLLGTQIPVEARIIAVADTYDVLVSNRPYREAMPGEKALQILREESGSHLDPAITAALFRILERGEDPRLIRLKVAS